MPGPSGSLLGSQNYNLTAFTEKSYTSSDLQAAIDTCVRVQIDACGRYNDYYAKKQELDNRLAWLTAEKYRMEKILSYGKQDPWPSMFRGCGPCGLFDTGGAARCNWAPISESWNSQMCEEGGLVQKENCKGGSKGDCDNGGWVYAYKLPNADTSGIVYARRRWQNVFACANGTIADGKCEDRGIADAHPRKLTDHIIDMVWEGCYDWLASQVSTDKTTPFDVKLKMLKDANNGGLRKNDDFQLTDTNLFKTRFCGGAYDKALSCMKTNNRMRFEQDELARIDTSMNFVNKLRDNNVPPNTSTTCALCVGINNLNCQNGECGNNTQINRCQNVIDAAKSCVDAGLIYNAETKQCRDSAGKVTDPINAIADANLNKAAAAYATKDVQATGSNAVSATPTATASGSSGGPSGSPSSTKTSSSSNKTIYIIIGVVVSIILLVLCFVVLGAVGYITLK